MSRVNCYQYINNSRSNYMRRATVLLVVAAACSLAGNIRADAITWSGSASGNWSSSANWAGGTVPVGVDTGILGETSVDRKVVYDSSASGALGALSISQNSAFANVLYVQRNLTVTNAITLEAGNGGTSMLLINPTSTTSNGNITLTVPQVNINVGGVLELTGYQTAGNTYQQSAVSGNVIINGGALHIASSRVPSGNPGSAIADGINGSLTMSSGSIVLGSAPRSDTTAVGLSGTVRSIDQRLNISGNVNITGGTISNGYASGTGRLVLLGANNTITGLDENPSSRIQIALMGRDQTLTTDAIFDTLIIRKTSSETGVASGITTLGAGGGQTSMTVGQIQFGTYQNGGVATLKLSSDVVVNTAAPVAQWGAGSGNTITFGIDANGHTFDLSAVAAGWTPNNGASGSNVIWSLTNSAGAATPGVIKARSYNFNNAYAVNVGADVRLIATGGNGTTLNLSNSRGTIDATSVFEYAGNASAANAALLTSTRTIGHLAVSSGALKLNSNITTAVTSSVSVNDGAILDLGQKTLTTKSLTVNGTLAGSGAVTTTDKTVLAGTRVVNLAGDSSFDVIDFGGSDVTFGGVLSLNFTYTPIIGAHYTLFSNIGSGTGAFDSIVSNLSPDYALSFDSGTGVLSIHAAEIPEPATLLLLGSGILAAVGGHRRKH